MTTETNTNTATPAVDTRKYRNKRHAIIRALKLDTRIPRETIKNISDKTWVDDNIAKTMARREKVANFATAVRDILALEIVMQNRAELENILTINDDRLFNDTVSAALALLATNCDAYLVRNGYQDIT